MRRCALDTPSSRTCATTHGSLTPQISPLWEVWSSVFNRALARVLVPEVRQKFHGQLQRIEALAAGDQGGQRWLEDDSWATHAMACLVLVSPLGVRGALAAAHALLQFTGGHFAFNGPALLWLPPATLLDSGTTSTHRRQLTKRPSTRNSN